MVKTPEQMVEEAGNIIEEISERAGAGELDNKMIAALLSKTARLLKELAEAHALLHQRVDVLSEKP
ncbi:hypothetical protein [Candidatus Pyrohabitans sp.]